MLDLAVFVPRLKQVIAWTEKRMKEFVYLPDIQNYGAIFRQINPIVNGQPLYSSDKGYITWNVDVYELENFQQALQAAYMQRDAEASETSIDFADFQKLGRILYFETQLTTHDGVAIVESNCFVDESDVPPIDTWFYLDTLPHLRRPLLLCWIPKRFEQLMQAAIDVEMFNSYHWLDEAGPLTHRGIAAAMAN